MRQPQKLSRATDDGWIDYSHPPVFEVQSTSSGERLVVGVPSGDKTVFAKLLNQLSPPYALLYVLHTPRGEGPAGRYQSPEVDDAELRHFLARFSDFLAGDARYDLWARSAEDAATVVWDRHNLIYAYGPIKRFSASLREVGFSEGSLAGAFGHVHHYREQFNPDAAAVLTHFHWEWSPLREEDAQ